MKDLKGLLQLSSEQLRMVEELIDQFTKTPDHAPKWLIRQLGNNEQPNYPLVDVLVKISELETHDPSALPTALTPVIHDQIKKACNQTELDAFWLSLVGEETKTTDVAFGLRPFDLACGFWLYCRHSKNWQEFIDISLQLQTSVLSDKDRTNLQTRAEELTTIIEAGRKGEKASQAEMELLLRAGMRGYLPAITLAFHFMQQSTESLENKRTFVQALQQSELVKIYGAPAATVIAVELDRMGYRYQQQRDPDTATLFFTGAVHYLALSNLLQPCSPKNMAVFCPEGAAASLAKRFPKLSASCTRRNYAPLHGRALTTSTDQSLVWGYGRSVGLNDTDITIAIRRASSTLASTISSTESSHPLAAA